MNRAISIHAPRTGSDGAGLPNQPGHDISIHAPRTGSDKIPLFPAFVQRHFNPRSPHGERRTDSTCWATPSDFNPRSPHGERPGRAAGRGKPQDISIHAPRTGSDKIQQAKDRLTELFQSTLPARGATISSSRPRGAEKFQSTLPARGATRSAVSPGRWERISIHAPRTGSDAVGSVAGALGKDFNPRSPHGERHRRCGQAGRHDDFNPRSPHGERQGNRLSDGHACPFQSTLPARGATVVA